MKLKKLFLFTILIYITQAVVFAIPVTIRLGYNNMPPNSPWSQGLERLAAEWKQVTNGEVILQIKHAQGDETIILQKINSGYLEACVFDSIAMASIAQDILVLGIPSLIKDDAELDYVIEKITPYIKSKFEAKKSPELVFTMFIKAGWINFFSRKAILYPEDLKKQKLAVNPNQPEIAQVWTSLGFSINTSPGILIQQLSNKIIDVFYMSPLWVATQWKSLQAQTPYMFNMKIAPALAGLFIKKDVWLKISESNRQKMMDTAKTIVKDIEKQTIEEEKKALSQLTTKGLIITNTTVDATQKWEENFQAGLQKGMNKLFSEEMLNKVRTIITEYRKTK